MGSAGSASAVVANSGVPTILLGWPVRVLPPRCPTLSAETDGGETTPVSIASTGCGDWRATKRGEKP